MALYLDSAEVEDARQAVALGFVAGITTNPMLVARTGRPAQEVITDLCCLSLAEVFYQLTERTPEAMENEENPYLGWESIKFSLNHHRGAGFGLSVPKPRWFNGLGTESFMHRYTDCSQIGSQ